MINFLGRKFNRRIFSGMLLLVLVVGGSFLMDNNSVWADEFGDMNDGLGGDNGNTITSVDTMDVVARTGYANEKPLDGLKRGDPSVWLVQIASALLQWTVSEELYNEVFFSDIAKEGITQAWEAVRGLINMFYLLILVFLAITTILRINKFNDKKLFFNVIVSAILVNFSMALTLVVIDFSNLIMTYFASAIQGVDPVNHFFREVGMSKNYIGDADTSWFLENGSKMIGFIINIIMAVMILFTAISLLIRLIAYWVLIILSPLAFFSIALPGSNGFKEWSDKLIHYSFYGPIMLFFIWLAMSLSTYLNGAFANASEIGGTEGFTKFLTSYITVLYLLYYGHDKSKAMASKAGDFAGKIMDKGGQYAVKAGKGAGIVATGGLPVLAKRHAVANYVGAKALMKKMGIGEEAGKEKQHEIDTIAKARWTGGDVKQAKSRLEMEAIEKTKADLKDKVDLKNRDQVLNLLNNGSNNEKKMAAQIAAQEGWLDGDNLGTALKIAEKNKLLTQSIKAGAGAKNKISSMNYNLAEYAASAKDSDAEKGVHGNIKSLMMARAVREGKKELADEIDKKSRLSKEEVNSFVSRQFGDGERKKAVHYGMFEGANSMNKIADLLNEKMSMRDKDELTANFAEYLKDDRFSGARFSKGNNLNRLESMVNPIVTINLRNAGVIGNNETSTQQNRRPRGPVDENGVEDLTRDLT